MSEIHSCPRRGENMVPTNWPATDTWEPGTSLAGHEADDRFRHCSYCGSVHPDDFMAKVLEGWFVGPTDKSYKAYLGEPCEPRTLLGSVVIDHDDVGKFYYQHLSTEQRHEFIELYNAKRMKLGMPGRFYVRPYFAVAASPEEAK